MKENAVNWKKITLLACSGYVIVLCAVVSWEIPPPPIPRVRDFIYGVFLVGWFITLFAWTRDDEYTVNCRYCSQLHRWAGLAFSLSLLLSSNTQKAVKDLIGTETVMSYKSEMRERYQQLSLAKVGNQSEVTVPALSFEPNSFFSAELGTDPGHSINRCVAKYFGLPRIRRIPKMCSYYYLDEVIHFQC